MPSSLPSSLQYNGLIKVSLVALLLVAVALLYFPGITGAFYYDDIRPLSPLATITNLESALVYVSSESSGPLGRPISMLSFLLHINDWPSNTAIGNSSSFFIFNIILHITNGLLVFLLSFVIAKLYHGESKANYWLAIAASAFWLVLPIQVSTSLIAIQRMAGLSAFFVFAGLLLYCYGLHKQALESAGASHNVSGSNNHKNNRGLVLQLTGLIVFTLLAMLAKENGVLLPVFALVLEVTLFAKISSIQQRRQLRISACSAGLITLLLYLAYSVITGSNISPGRDQTLVERILTEPQILLEYLQIAFIPDIEAINPFHDNYPKVTHLLSSNKAVFSLLLLITSLSSALYYRKKYPLFAFAVLWFLAAHLIESSVINLELYFEHRNYVALFGPCMAIVFSFAKIKPRYQRLAIIVFSAYWLLLCACLLLTTQLWGQPNIAAQTWQVKQENSERATGHLGAIYLQEGKIDAAQQLLLKQVSECKSCANSLSMSLFLSCYSNKEQATRNAYNALLNLAKTTTRATGVGANLSQTHQLITNGHCKYINLAELKALNIALLKSPESPFNKKLAYLQNLYVLSLHEKNRDEAIRLLLLAWQEQPDDIIANEVVSMLIANQQSQKAKIFIQQQVCQRTSFNPIIAKVKQKQCKNLTKRVEAAIAKSVKIKANTDIPTTPMIEDNNEH